MVHDTAHLGFSSLPKETLISRFEPQSPNNGIFSQYPKEKGISRGTPRFDNSTKAFNIIWPKLF